ncbi:MAG: ChaN family lipoprotein [Nitrospirota bacterium]
MRMNTAISLHILALCKVLLLVPAVFLALQTFSQQEVGAETRVFRLKDRKNISYTQMIQEIRNADLVLIGEVHTQASHHRNQLRIIEALHGTKTPLAVGFEMFTAENQKILDRWVAGTLSSNAFIDSYYRNWNYPWTLYRDIFLYLRKKKIPAIGLNLPPEITRKVSTSGFASLTKEELAKLPPETGCAVDEKYMKFIRRAYAMHGHGGKEFIYFCEAQLLWDQTMARNLLKFKKKNPKKTVVALTGNGHAWKRGIPEQVRALSPGTKYRVILPYIPNYIEPRLVNAEDADYIVLQ